MSLKNLSLSKRLYGGIGIILILLALIGYLGWHQLSNSNEGFSTYRNLARDSNLSGLLQADMLMVRMNVKDFIITSSKKDIEQFQEYAHKMEELLAEAKKEIHNPERAAKIKLVDEEIKAYKAGFDQVVVLMAKRNEMVNGVLNVKGPEMEKKLSAILDTAARDNDMEAAYHAGLAMRDLLLARLYVVKFLEENNQAAVDRVNKEFKEFDEELKILHSKIQNPDRMKLLKEVEASQDTYHHTFTDLAALIFKRNDIIQNTLDKIGPMVAENVEAVKLSLKKEQDTLGPQIQSDNVAAEIEIAVGVAVAIIVGMLLAFFLTRSIVKPVNEVIAGLSSGSDEVNMASAELNKTSQSLAEGASEQAASLEETTSSMEEIGSMTRQNAENAGQTDGMMKDMSAVMNRASDSMSQVRQAMENINQASDETAKIIKTIDEIAFQTNLLALNAAVEAARAGEAGAGFAVVADEVRNLAMRAAEAAKNTATLIEENIKEIKSGAELVVSTDENFSEVRENASKVGELVSEIASASNEQAQGIDQVNRALNEMDKLTQQNAANAEESASAAEELNAQADGMRSFVQKLIDVVGGSAAN
jgi:methyl-accepting chemotaxis protein